jgi:hypothetical protein
LEQLEAGTTSKGKRRDRTALSVEGDPALEVRNEKFRLKNLEGVVFWPFRLGRKNKRIGLLGSLRSGKAVGKRFQLHLWRPIDLVHGRWNWLDGC